MARQSLFDSFLRYLASQGYDVPAEALARDVERPAEPTSAVQRVLLHFGRDLRRWADGGDRAGAVVVEPRPDPLAQGVMVGQRLGRNR
jgi:hypothetical protein